MDAPPGTKMWRSFSNTLETRRIEGDAKIVYLTMYIEQSISILNADKSDVDYASMVFGPYSIQSKG